ncbi:acyl-CoA thioesterase [Candidatus Nitrospira bockiana]
MNVRIYYEDTDCGGVVYYANYLKYFERARTHYLDDHGVSVTTLLAQGTQFMVVQAALTYRSPGRYGDTLTIDTWLSARSKASMTFAHSIRERASRRLVVEGSATLVAVDREGRLIRLPRCILELPSGNPPRPTARRSTARRRLPR